MPLASRSALKNHTIRAFRAAALARYREAKTLVVSEQRLAGIYLMGYSAEMLLKAAYFRLVGFHFSQKISLQDLQAAKVYAVKTLKCPWYGNLHDLRGWQTLLTEERSARGASYDRSFSRSLNATVTRLALNWWETLRYHDMQPYRGEVSACVRAVTWLVGEYRSL